MATGLLKRYPLLPFYARAFGGGAEILGLLIAAFFAMQFVSSPILGRLSDRVGRRPVLMGTLVLAMVGYLILSIANSLLLLFVARILAGTASGNLSVAQAYVADRTTPRERARGMGLLGAAFGVGFAVGPVIGGAFAPFGLGVPALAAAALAGTNFALAGLFLPESLTPEAKRANVTAPRTSFWQAIRRPSIRALMITFFLVSFAFSTVPVAFPSLGIAYFGIGPTELALLFIYIGVINLVFGTAAGRLARRAGEERLVAAGTFAMMAGLAAVPLIANISAYVLLTGVVATGVAIAFPLVPSLVSKRTPPQEQGAILGITQSFGSLARIPGPLVAGLLFEQVHPAAPFLLGAVLMAVGFGMTLLVYRESRRRASEQAVPASSSKSDSLR